MNKKLKNSVIDFSFYTKKLYEIIEDIEFGVIPNEKELEHIFSKIEGADNKRVSLLKAMDEKELSSSFADLIQFKDGGMIDKGKLVGPVEGAIDFVMEHEDSSNVFLAQMAEYVAICI